jgi:hypothetical protein
MADQAWVEDGRQHFTGETAVPIYPAASVLAGIRRKRKRILADATGDAVERTRILLGTAHRDDPGRQGVRVLRVPSGPGRVADVSTVPGTNIDESRAIYSYHHPPVLRQPALIVRRLRSKAHLRVGTHMWRQKRIWR